MTGFAQQVGSVTDEQIWDVWEVEMLAASCSPRTVRERGYIFRSLRNFVQKPLVDASRADLMRWLARPDLSPKTRQNYKSFLHTMYAVMQDNGLRLDNPATRMPRTRVPRQEANPLSTESIEKLLSTPMYARTRMMILLAAYQGFRATEIASVHGENIDWATKSIFVAGGKGGVEVWRPLHPIIEEAARSMPRDDWWFPGTKRLAGFHVNASSVSNTISQVMKRAGIRGHRPHQLRAWHATELAESGADMLTIQDALRHANTASLRHYVRPSMTNLASALTRLPDVSGVTSSRRRAGGVEAAVV